ncbi:hypothetical protein C9374_013652 [Naegleria lovaniensis]|uniref:Glycosyltransferase 61 catalytic domain-containing protein n=1 Tax=Naegleria lovaniensis TaxID=51637 RepID=A0AA88KHC1_NAELO|nr:uncharacterized protein C9374_013652 [Naegleria lovaniensis]KAG2372697.1 hypothetical protein C9374_013652 [Naegleria lovaniensis]
MASCKLENLCLTQSGEFVLFQSHNRILHHDMNELNSRPFVFVQGSTIDSNRGNFYIRHINGDLVFEKSHPHNHTMAFVTRIKKKESECGQQDYFCESQVEEEYHYDPIALSPNFTYYEKPVYALQRYAAGNIGHIFAESLAMIMGLMMNFNHPFVEMETLRENHVLFLDDLFDLSGENWRGAFGYDSTKAEHYSLLTMQLITKNPMLQLCSRDGIWRIENAPCRIMSTLENPRMTESISSMTLDSCFSNIYMGHTISNLVLHPYGKEGLFMKLREFIYRNLRIFPFDQTYSISQKKKQFKRYLLEKDIVIALHQKDKKGRHGQSFHNSEEFLNYLQLELPKQPFIQQLMQKNKTLQRRTLKFDIIDFSKFPSIADQVKYFANVDVYITDPGSAAYYSLFFREDTTVFLPPTCHRLGREIHCFTSHGKLVLSSLPNIQMLDMMELNGNQAQCNFRPAPDMYFNCNYKLPLKLMLNQVMKALKKRYRMVLTEFTELD